MKSTRIAIALAWSAAVLSARAEYPHCVILDGTDWPAWSVDLSYDVNADLPTTGESVGIFTTRGGGGLGFYELSSMDIDLTGSYDIRGLSGDGGMDLPGALGALSLNAAFTTRNMDGLAFRFSLSPGIYSDLGALSAESLNCPVGLSSIQSFNDQVSTIVGVNLYPGFDQFVDPVIGLRWVASDSVQVDLQYPASRLSIRPVEGMEVYAGFEMRQAQEWYTEAVYGNLGLDEMRARLGLEYFISETIRIRYEAGYAFNREFEGEAGGKVEMEDAVFAGIGFTGDF